MICQICEEKEATVEYGDLYFFCFDCNHRYLEEVAKDYGIDNDECSFLKKGGK